MIINSQRTEHNLPPKGLEVIVAGGTAMLKNDGNWYSGFEEPYFERQLEWTPKWWAHFPIENT